MTRPCASCGLRHCRGECYLDYPAEPEIEVAAPREPYVPSPEYLAWLADLEPKKRPDGRWEIAA